MHKLCARSQYMIYKVMMTKDMVKCTTVCYVYSVREMPQSFVESFEDTSGIVNV